jgi:photosystem II stability/assembly factor-like uncharacterized protein
MVRRVKLTGRYVFPMLLFVEALFVPLVLGSVIKGALGQRPFLTFTSLGFVRDQMHFETAWFVVFAAALLVVASVLGWAGVRAVSVTHDAGTSWATTLRLSRYALPSEALSCPSTSDCYFVTLGPVSPEQPQSGLSFSVYSTTDGGRSWHGHTLLDNSPGGISNVVCRTALQCLVTAGGTWWATVNGGDTWTEHAPPVGLPTGVTASCSYAMACWALVGAPASSMVSSRDGGGRWQRVGTFPPGFRGFESACVNELDCTVIGGTYPHGILEAQIVTTTDGGRSWALTPFPELPSRWLPRPVSIG